MDLSLPDRAPTDTPSVMHISQEFAIYTLVPVDLAALSKAINSVENMSDTSRCPPRADFSSSQKLRDVYDYHLQLRDEDSSFHPLFFIIATDRDYESKGLIIVHLDTYYGEESGVVDIARCSLDRAASWCVNFDISNMDWDELKDNDEWEHGSDAAQGPELASTLRAADAAAAAAETEQQSPPRKKYGWYSLVQGAVPIYEYFQPGWSSAPHSSHRIQLLANLSQEPGTYITHIREIHPWHATARGHVHPQLLLVATEKCTSADAAEGAELVRLRWDGKTKTGKLRKADMEDLRRLNPEWETLERTRASEAVERLDAWAEELGLVV